MEQNGHAPAVQSAQKVLKGLSKTQFGTLTHKLFLLL